MSSEKKEYEKVIDYLKDLTEKGTIKIGSKLPTERALSETLSVSRNSTREAIRMLENMGFIESKHGSGNYVVGNISKSIAGCIDMMLLLNKISMADICSFRRSMEKDVCTTIIEKGLSEKCDKDLLQIIKKSENDISEEEQIETDRLFHFTLIEATENEFLIILSKSIIDIYRRWIDKAISTSSEEAKKEILNSHIGVYNALKDGDINLCRDWIDKHYDIVDTELKRGMDDEI